MRFSGALSTDRLEREIHLLVEKFWARIALPLAELTQSILSRTDRAALGEFIDLEERLGMALTKLIKGVGMGLLRISSAGYRLSSIATDGLLRGSLS